MKGQSTPCVNQTSVNGGDHSAARAQYFAAPPQMEWLVTAVVVAAMVAAICATQRASAPPPPVHTESRQDSLLLVLPCADGALHATVLSAYTKARFPHRVHVALVVPPGTPADALRHSLEGLGLFLWATNVQWIETDAVRRSDAAARAAVAYHHDLVVHVRDCLDFGDQWDCRVVADFLAATRQHRTTSLALSRPVEGFAAVAQHTHAITQLPAAVALRAAMPMPMSSAWWCGAWAVAPGFVFSAVPFDAHAVGDGASEDVVYSARLHRASVRVVHPALVPARLVYAGGVGSPPTLAGGRRLRSQLGLAANPGDLPEAPLTADQLAAFGAYCGVDFAARAVGDGAWGLTPDSGQRERLVRTGTL